MCLASETHNVKRVEIIICSILPHIGFSGIQIKWVEIKQMALLNI